MISLDKIVKTEVLKQTEHLLDTLQFAYRHGKGMKDATLTILNLIHKHLKKKKIPCRNSRVVRRFFISVQDPSTSLTAEEAIIWH